MTTGLHGTIEAQVTGESIDELYTIASSSMVTTNKLLFTTDSEGQRKEQGTNTTIDLFSDYMDPFLRDANYPNNYSSQAPITPHTSSGKPEGYIAYKSSTLLGNIIKGKTSSRYYRTLRNGKETEF